MAARIEPTPEQLHTAWLQRRRADWPATLDATLAVPLLAALVRAEAVRRCLRDRQIQRSTRTWPRYRAYPAPAGAPAAPPQRQPLDRKRLAAGERDDD